MKKYLLSLSCKTCLSYHVIYLPKVTNTVVKTIRKVFYTPTQWAMYMGRNASSVKIITSIKYKILRVPYDVRPNKSVSWLLRKVTLVLIFERPVLFKLLSASLPGFYHNFFCICICILYLYFIFVFYISILYMYFIIVFYFCILYLYLHVLPLHWTILFC